MKKTLLALIATGMFAAHASANLYTDSDNYWNVSIQQGSPVTKEFDIAEWGYDHSTEQVYSATASFLLVDLWGGSETLTVSLGGGAPVLLSDPVLITMAVGTSALLDLSSDGKLSFTLTALTGQTYLSNATLIAWAGGARGVPDGGFTLTLLGLSFLGILSAQRKFALAR